MKKPKMEDCELKSVKKLKGGGVKVEFEYQETEKDSEEVFNTTLNLKSDRPISDDLESLFSRLKGMLMKVYEYDKLKKQDEVAEMIKITGISVGGKDEHAGLVITGTLKSQSGKLIALNSGFQPYVQNIYGFEEELEDLVDSFLYETHAYIYEGKSKQLQAAFA